MKRLIGRRQLKTREQVQPFDPMKDNVEANARLEQEALLQRSGGERVSDFITRTIGTMNFVLLHLAVLAGWIVVNSGVVPGITPFDPFPFGIMTMVLSGEGVLLALFVLISQNRMSRQADRRAHIDLQVSMLAEQELTLLLQMQKRICDTLHVDLRGIEHENGAVQQLMEKTDVEHLVHELEQQLPEE
ncbi:MAG TPA: DUF1003 domain-containing protein [Chloroflexota bacterium]|nr:DUF1003 domain-containing protein [Chloroflexota bacterium]